MSNLACINIEPNTEYQNLATLAEVTFVSGTIYTIQVDGDVLLCEAASKPTKGGFHIFTQDPIQFEAGSDALWVKNLRQFESASINIAE